MKYIKWLRFNCAQKEKQGWGEWRKKVVEEVEEEEKKEGIKKNNDLCSSEGR